MQGPLMLELNARPGLNIQIANRCGLLKRLPLVDSTADGLDSVDARVDFAIAHFGVGARPSS